MSFVLYHLAWRYGAWFPSVVIFAGRCARDDFFPLCLFISDLVVAAVAGRVMHENMRESGRARLARVRLARV
jgi:hypothetical protein